MSAQLNHTIVLCRDRQASAGFLAGILGRPAPARSEPFEVVPLDNGVSLDFMETQGAVEAQHYAFLIDEGDFDGVFGRIQAKGDYWADPACQRSGEINHRLGGRGCYFLDPDGHLLEVLTRAS
jgi:catechol 2,3-dioxygenase-like lactoylglutathione lyase family enzyme